MSNCPLMKIEYDENGNQIFFCSSVKPHQLERKTYTDEEKKALDLAWAPNRRVFSKFVEDSSCSTSYAFCELYRDTIKPYLEKAGFRENHKCPHYGGQSPLKGQKRTIMVDCKLSGTRRGFDEGKPIICRTDCHSCVHIWSDWWKETGRCKFQEVLRDWVVEKDDDGWIKKIRYIKFNCKASGETNITLEHSRCGQWKHQCRDYNKARANEIGFVEAYFLPR